MYQVVNIVNLLVSILLAIIWGLAAVRTGVLAFRPNMENMKNVARRLRWAFSIVSVLFFIKLAISVYFSTLGWDFVRESILVVLPFLLPTTIATMIFTFPTVWKIAKDKNFEEENFERIRRIVFHPKVIVPVQATFLGAFFAAYFTDFQYPFTLNWLNTFFVWILFTAVVIVLWFRQQRRYHKLSQYGSRRIDRIRRAIPLMLTVVVCLTSWFYYSIEISRVPKQYNMADHNMTDDQQMTSELVTTAHAHGNHQGHEQSISVTDLKGPQTQTPDHRFTLVAKKQKIRLSSGKTMEAWTFNGQTPGPELKVNEGDLVEVTLKNQDINEGVTIHWHGYNVPNGEDGVAGVTQNAVRPRETYTYRFIAKQVGTYWYHSHQQSSIQVSKGLFGALVVLPKNNSEQKVKDITVLDHPWNISEDADPIGAFGTNDTVSKQRVEPGTKVRLRLINAGNDVRYFLLSGTTFQVDAIDGNQINSPTDLVDQRLLLGGGNRYDITFTMPKHPVKLLSQNAAGKVTGRMKAEMILLNSNGSNKMPNVKEKASIFDPSKYGKPKATIIDLKSKFNHKYKLFLDNRFGFFDGKVTVPVYSINGKLFPHTPMIHVKNGDLVKITYVNRGNMDHPIHLHGHHMLVLSRDGKPNTGSPWWADTLNVGPGETYEVAFVADNPGIWMDHCHNLSHAAVGMTMHVLYDGITTPFKAGEASLNQPE